MPKSPFINRVANAVTAFTGQTQEKTTNSIRGTAEDFLRFGNRGNKPLQQDWSQVEMSDQDMYTGYSYAAIKKRANRASALGKKFLFTDASKAVQESAKKSDTEIQHPYLELIRKSKQFSRRKFWHDISVYLDLEGVYYLMAVRAIKTNAKGEVSVGGIQKFEMLNPYQVRRVTKHSDGTLGGYIESKDGLYREIPKEMIIEIRLLNPFDNDVPYSMTDAAKDSQFTLKQAADYTRHSIKGNINAPGAISTGVELEDHVFDNFVSRIENHSKGEPLYGNGTGAINWASMQIDLDKAGLDKINEINRAVLFAVTGTSKTTLGIEESGTTRDTSETQKDNFTEDAVMPQVEDILDALNLDYRQNYPEWDNNEYEITLDNPLATNRESELKDIEIRESELSLRETLIEKGYEYEIASKYAHGDITLEELGEPTLEAELSDEEADIIAAKELGQEPSDSEDEEEVENEDEEITTENRFVTTNKFVNPKDNKKKVREAIKRRKVAPKMDEAKKSEEQSKKIIADEQQTKKVTEKDKKTRVIVELQNEVEDKVVNQVSIRDNFPDLYEGLIVDSRAITDDKYRGCIMINTVKIPVTQLVKNGEADLVYETDRHEHTMGAVAEVEPHATLLYGLLNNGNIWKEKVDMVLSGWEMPTVKIKEVSYFQLEDSKAVIALLEETPEIKDANQRLGLLPHLNTFSEYHPHITLAYITDDADVEKWVKSLSKKYNGQIVATNGINYGDTLDEDSDITENHIEDEYDMEYLLKASKVVKKKIVSKNNSIESNSKDAHTHLGDEHAFVHNSTLDKATNALDPSMKDSVILQQSNLENAVKGLEADVVNAVIEALRNGDLAEAEEIISQAQVDTITAQMVIILAGFFTILFPIYAAQLMINRLTRFGRQGVFAWTDDVEEYIENSAHEAAESHIQTVVRDITKVVDQTSDKVVQQNLIRIVQDKVNAREEDYMSRLPENPNLEDIKSAVIKGKFDDSEAYKLAREQIRTGEGLEQITKAIQQAYSHISETRAKTIARHESSRVFNMSQYQADLQFLTESNNIDKAYKRLRSRSDEPCAVCAMLIKKTTANPIPFAKNFADLGDELTASYKKANGKMAVQKLPISYEAIKAGNVHVNCNCEYELVIKNDDGTYNNSIDFRVNNAEGDDYNPYRAKDGKFASGPSSGGSTSLKTSEPTPISKEERQKSIERFKELQEEIAVFFALDNSNGGLTSKEAEEVEALRMEQSEIMFKIGKPIKLEKIASKSETKSDLSSDVVVAASTDKFSNRDAYMAIDSAFNGTYHDSDTAVDDVMNGKNKDISAQEFYDTFSNTRKALAKQYGTTVPLYRAEGKQKQKYTKNWATTKEFVKQFGEDIKSESIPIENIIAVNVINNGKYHEIIVGKPPTSNTGIDPSTGMGKVKLDTKASKSNSVLSNMLISAKANGGMTTDIEGNSPSEGIAFAPRKDTEKIISSTNFDEKALDSFIDEHFEILQEEGMHIGGWFNEEDGNWYLDISKVGGYNKDIIQEAQDAEQLAVFDLKSFKEIKTGDIKDGKYEKAGEPEAIFDKAFGKGNEGTVQKASDEDDESDTQEEITDFGYDNDGYDVKDYILEEYDSIEFSDTEQAAIHEYTGGRYQSVNHILRHGTPHQDDKSPRKSEEVAVSLIEAIDKTSLVEDIIVYRGSGFNEKITIGEIIRDKGFSSTSLQAEVATEFTGSEENENKPFKYIMKIKLRKGTKAIFPAIAGVAGEENELILAPGTGFKVISIIEADDENDNDYQTLELELV